MTSRTLKIEIAGDFFRRKTYPKIRLQGKWLAKLGFPARQPRCGCSNGGRGNHTQGGKADTMNASGRDLGDIFGEPIAVYTRKQAIEDGVLVDLMQAETVSLVREVGFRFPVAMTAGAFVATVAEIGEPLPKGQDIRGRLWDVLWMLTCAIRTAGSTTV